MRTGAGRSVDLLHLAALALVMLWPLDLLATRIQRRTLRLDPENAALRSRVVAGYALSSGSTISAALGLAVLLGLELPRGLGLAALVMVLLLARLPQINWLRLYVTDGFAERDG